MPTEPTWEERMAASARKRQTVYNFQEQLQQAEQAARERAFNELDLDAKAHHLQTIDPITPEQARNLLDEPAVACACLGGPGCCIIRRRRAEIVSAR